MAVREKFVARILNQPEDFRLSEARFIHTPQIFTAHSTRLRCQYTCSHTRQSDTVPPHSPEVRETREVLDEYRYGLMLRAEEPWGRRESAEVWEEFAAQVLAIEGDCVKQGYSRAFVLAVGTCLFQHADDMLRPCEYPSKRRPTFEAMGIDLKETLEMVQWSDYVQRGDSAPLQQLALLLLE